MVAPMFHVEHETFHTLSCLACWVVSIHAHVKGATLPIRLTTKTHCFNPRAREGRDSPGRGGRWCRSVSIHAPTSGATVRQTSKPSMSGFQSTRPRRARPQRYIGRSRSRVFQSTRPRGTRRVLPDDVTSGEVSIHASARDATYSAPGVTLLTCFNPRVRAGRDPHRRLSQHQLQFQSTRPRGTRPEKSMFYPLFSDVSIHASARDATSSGTETESFSSVSIHASARDATL